MDCVQSRCDHLKLWGIAELSWNQVIDSSMKVGINAVADDLNWEREQAETGGVVPCLRLSLLSNLMLVLLKKIVLEYHCYCHRHCFDTLGMQSGVGYVYHQV
jgi:hypothetical protein